MNSPNILNFCRTIICAFLAFSASANDEVFYTPETDMAGLNTHTEKQETLPNVLLLGDSISIGYTPYVIADLKGIANTERANRNCGHTISGLKNIDKWIGDKHWDVIHFNWGLHDLCYREKDSPLYGAQDKVNGLQSVPLEEYKANLETLVKRMEQTGAILIWANTTYVPEDEPGRFQGDEVRYNEAAIEIMNAHGIMIDDLYTVSAQFPPDFWSKPGNVHFRKNGSEALAQKVAESIKNALENRVSP